MTYEVKPQPGFQYDFLSTSADIAIGGGAAGAGKSWALLLECLRHTTLVPNPDFGAILFRRTFPEIIKKGGLWDESKKIFSTVSANPLESKLLWRFPSKATVAFSHLQHEKDIYSYQGSQIPLICFDEVTHFSEEMFFYLATRNRSTCGVKPYMRATCNPDPDSWVARFIEWWIDQDTGYPIPDRAGKLRYFVRDGEAYIWGDTKQEVIKKAPHVFNLQLFQGQNKEDLVKSVTFIPGKIDDNQELLKVNPEYLANLLAQDDETQMRLLRGNWKYRADNMGLFDPVCLNNTFTNDLVNDRRDKDFIVIDHARFGKDFCVIGTWKGWSCVRIDVLPFSSSIDIIEVIKKIRTIYRRIPMSQVLIDQDGIGVQDNIGCRIFQPGATAHDLKKKKQFFKNRKTQCAYTLAEKINQNEIHVDLTNVWFHHQGATRKIASLRIKGKKQSIKDLIIDDLRTLKREKVDLDQRKQMTTKEAQKSVLGRSPDFGDMLIMRAEFEFVKFPKSLKKM